MKPMMREDLTKAAPSQGSPLKGWPPQLLRSLLFAFGLLLVVRLGQWIPLSGLDDEALSQILYRPREAPFGLIYTADLLSKFNIFALGLWPFVYAWVATELLFAGRPTHKRAAHRRWLTLLIAISMAAYTTFGYGSITTMDNWGRWSTINLVREPGPLFWAFAVMTLTAGTMLLLWLGEQITKTGICDGIWLIVAVGFIAKIPTGAIAAWQMFQWGVFSFSGLLLLVGVLVTAATLTVLMQRATRCIPNRNQIDDAEKGVADLKLSLDYVTIVPAVLATLFLTGAVSIVHYLHAQLGDQAPILIAYLAKGQPLHLLIYALLILALTVILTLRVAPPQVLAGYQSESGSLMIAPAPVETFKHVEFILSRLVIVTAAYLLIINLLPALLMRYAKVPIHLEGISIMIVVIVMLDIHERAKARHRSDRSQ